MLKEAEGAYRRSGWPPQPSGFGAEITGLDLSRPLPAQTLSEVKAAFAAHGVVAFPTSRFSLDELEAFTLQIGPFGDDPYVAPMPGHPNVLEVRREPSEKLTPFGGAWHSDWSFQDARRPPPSCARPVIPPVAATPSTATPAGLRGPGSGHQGEMPPLKAVHSATRAYGRRAAYSRELDQRSMPIIVSPEADKTHAHPLSAPTRDGRKRFFSRRSTPSALRG
jgi:taurine dioxygenase